MKRHSILTNNLEECIECGRYGVQLHEIFHGPNKKLSIKYGLVIPLCAALHHNGNAIGIHNDKELEDKWKTKGQEAFMKHYDKTEEDFRKIFGRNYIK